MRPTLQCVFLAVVIAVCSLGLRAGESAVEARNQPRDEQLIREVRARSNAAITAHDLDGIARAWMDDVHVVASTSAQAAGREANRQRMASQFASRPDTIYVRRPVTVEVYPAWAVASELGDWIGRWTEPDGPLEIGGTYQAQWRKVGGEWRIQAELYVPTHCTGGRYCRERP